MTLAETIPANSPTGFCPTSGAPRLWVDPYDGGTSTTITATPRWVCDSRHLDPLATFTPTRTVNVATIGQLRSALSSGTLQAGDHIRLAPNVTFDAGTDKIQVQGSGNIFQPIVIEAQPGSEWSTSSNSHTITGRGFEAIAQSWLVFRHLNLEDIGIGYTGGGGHRGIRIEGNTGLGQPIQYGFVVQGCRFDNIYSSAISIWGRSYGNDPGDYDNIRGIVCESNLIERATNGGFNEWITIANGCSDIDIRYNVLRNGIFDGVGDEGIDLKDGISNARIHGNIFYSLASRAIYLDGGEANFDGVSSPPWSVVPSVHDVEIYNNLVIGPLQGNGIACMSEGWGDVYDITIGQNIVLDMDSNRSGLEIFTHFDDRSTRFDGIRFLFNTSIDNGITEGGKGINVNGYVRPTTLRGAVDDTEIVGNLCWGNSDDTHDIRDTSSNDPSVYNLARNSGGVTFKENTDPELTYRADVSLQKLLFEPAVTSPAATPTDPIPWDPAWPAWLDYDFHGRPRTPGAPSYGAVQYLSDPTMFGVPAVTSWEASSATVAAEGSGDPSASDIPGTLSTTSTVATLARA